MNSYSRVVILLIMLVLLPASAPAQCDLELLSTIPGQTVQVEGRFAYVTKGTLFSIWDVSIPSVPQKVGEVTLPSILRAPITLSNGIAYVISNINFDPTMFIVDIHDPTAPTLLGQYHLAGQPFLDSILLNGSTAYLAEFQSGVEVLDVSDPTNPVAIGWLDDIPATAGVFELAYFAGHLFVCDYYGLIYVFNASDPLHPTYATSVYSPLFTTDMVLSNGFLYVVSYELPDLMIIDVRDPLHPTWTSHTFDGEGPGSFDAVIDNVAYINMGGILQIASGTNAEHMTPLPGKYYDRNRGTITASAAVQGRTLFAYNPDINQIEIKHIGHPAFTSQPKDRASKFRGFALFIANTKYIPDHTFYQWRHNGVDLTNGRTPHGSTISGATTRSLNITGISTEDAGTYELYIQHPIEYGYQCTFDNLSNPAKLEVLCPADFNGDRFVTGDDFDAFVKAFLAGRNSADMNADGFVTSDDFDEFVDHFLTGC